MKDFRRVHLALERRAGDTAMLALRPVPARAASTRTEFL